MSCGVVFAVRHDLLNVVRAHLLVVEDRDDHDWWCAWR